MPAPAGLTNAVVAAYLTSAESGAVSPVLAALQALQTAATAAQSALAGLPLTRTVQAVNNVAAMTQGYVTEFQTVQAQLSPLTTAAAPSIPALTVGQTATAFTPVSASGGVGAVSYAVTPALPAGLTISATTGAVTGTRTAAVTGSFTVTATDQSMPTPQISSQGFSLTVAPAAAG